MRTALHVYPGPTQQLLSFIFPEKQAGKQRLEKAIHMLAVRRIQVPCLGSRRCLGPAGLRVPIRGHISVQVHNASDVLHARVASRESHLLPQDISCEHGPGETLRCAPNQAAEEQ